MVTPAAASRDVEGQVWSLLATVADPEIPVLSVLDLGIVRDVEVTGAGVSVTITPTYSGCPAMGTIELDIRRALEAAGFGAVGIRIVLSPAWTSDWLTDAGREKLRAFGIAPPAATTSSKRALLGVDAHVACPRCGSTETELLSAFGSTACKALFRCRLCLDPFDHFKCI
jgi:ring-1,2-phenylacetyl-CoA epoxidase subunit PaaD